MSTITASAEERDDSQDGRLHFWQVAVAMANDRPLLGVGHAGYQSAYDQYDWSDGRYKTSRAVHSSLVRHSCRDWISRLRVVPVDRAFLVLGLSPRSPHGATRRSSRSLWPLRHRAGVGVDRVHRRRQFRVVPLREMLWHFFALTIALERVAVAQAASKREQRMRETKPALVEQPAEDFVWA